MFVTRETILTEAAVPASSIAEAARSLGLAFAWYRLPGEQRHILIVDTSNPGMIDGPEIEKLEPGFLFAPFQPGAMSVYLRANLMLSGDGDIFDTLHYSRPEYYLQAQELLTGGRKGIKDLSVQSSGISNSLIEKSSKKRHFLSMVRQAVGRIEAGDFSKVVLARKKTRKLPEGFNPGDFFLDLCRHYPSAFVSIVSAPQSGTWIGATPEPLFRVQCDGMFYTTALAGTQPFRMGKALSSVAWTQKAIEEQAMVSRYIINCFKKIRLREFEEDGPKTSRAGNLVHLRSDYSVNTKEVNFPNLGTVMLRLLHPTSAICGMPRDISLKFICEHEDFDRRYYAGYLGPVNIGDDTRIFVNLRCMEVRNGFAELYAGAGITRDSEEEKEWKETSLKIKTLEDALVRASVTGTVC